MIAKVSLNKDSISELPMLALRDVVVFPDTVNHFDVNREVSKKAIEHCMETGQPLFLVTQIDSSVEDPGPNDVYRYGVVSEVKQVLKVRDGLMKVIVDCKYRARLVSFDTVEGMYWASVHKRDATAIKSTEEEEAKALVRKIREELEVYASFNPRLSGDILDTANSGISPEKLVEYLAFNLPLETKDKQSVLQQGSSFKRLDLLLSIIVKENSVLGIEQEINERIQQNMINNQREFYLREQMRTISQELGEDMEDGESAYELKDKIRALPLEDAYKEKLLKEVDRLSMNPPSSPEYALIDQYLDTVLSMPWTESTKDNYNVEKARKILERDHYGLKDVKERILEYLAVRGRTSNISGQIICLVGPPGVGKTSIARSLAESMGRKFSRMSLGGVRDEAEIRGHRRTYIGAMPGRIIAAIQQAKTNNPLILMDEIDKLGYDYKGDPSSALLEALDPEQNTNFMDHYLDVPFDLSNVFFLTTANDINAIPSALRDRMDVIELSSYTRVEKFHIAKDHLLKKQMERHGMTRNDIRFSDKALYKIIDDYTIEAGVRNLERSIAKVLRKAAKMLSESEPAPIKVTDKNMDTFLGVPYNRESIASQEDSVGIVNGLAWTSAGGTLLPIEAVVIPGTGRLEITGSLGDVMKESIKLAITYGRTLTGDYKFPEKFLNEYDIHVPAPEGAVPKDGPSAGVTIATALVSAVCGIPVRKDVAMTGEITLQGRVLAIGGLKEKLIAAHKEKIRTVVIPASNVPDLQEIPDEVKNSLEIIPVKRIDEVLKIALKK